MHTAPLPPWLGVATDAGEIRPNNEDGYRVEPEWRLFAVADGMGGHRAGEVASALALEALNGCQLADGEPVQVLEAMVQRANERVLEVSRMRPDCRGMGTTLTVAHLRGEEVLIAHVGDSRAYLIGPGGARQLTRDHSLAGELLARGQIDPQGARDHPQRHVLTRAVGTQLPLQVDVGRTPVGDAHYLLLCTDGLTEVLLEEEIVEIVRSSAAAAPAAEALIEAARARGAPDNVTVVLVDLRLISSFPEEVDQQTRPGVRDGR